jgi:hypothetical protein
MKLNSDGAIEMVQGSYPVLCNIKAYEEFVGLCVDESEIWDESQLIL